MKNVLITGGAGFIGSHITATLIDQPETNVIAVDNFITSDYYNIEEFVRKPNFEFIKHDVTHPLQLDKFPELNKLRIKIYGIEEIYHFACPTSPKDYDRLPLETCLANSHATKNALDVAKQFKATFLFASSSAVYGNVPQQKQPIKETDTGSLETLGPRSCYTDGKRFAENLVVYSAAQYNFPAKIVRIFNTYGPKMRLNDGRIIPDFVAQALKNEPIIIYGNEDTASTFCFVSDLTDALLKVMSSNETGPFNLGGEQLFRLKDVAQAIITLTQSRSTVRFEAPLPYRIPEPIPDISRAKEKLGWIPITPLEEGLMQTVKVMQASQIIKFRPETDEEEK